MYGTYEQDKMYSEIKEYLKTHKLSEILDMLKTIVEHEEESGEA